MKLPVQIVLIFFWAKHVKSKEICVTEPLITSRICFPGCSTIDGRYFKNEENKYDSEDDEYKASCTKDPIDWVTCNVTEPTCDVNYKYRSFDGSCNNLKNPKWGMTLSAYNRLLPSNYRDRKRLLRVGAGGEALPSVRKLSTNVMPVGEVQDAVTLMAMQWGQLVAHDTALTLSLDTPDCCNSTHNEDICLTINFPKDDYFYSKYNVTCQSFPRNEFTRVEKDCTNGPSQQLNSDSSAIDGSLIYGSDLATANSLRTFKNGRLKMRKIRDGREFLTNLPQSEIAEECSVLSVKEPCYTAGDQRVNQNPQLATLVNLLQRAHNKIAGNLQKIHSNWNDETLYQETRRVLVAILQHIHYKEWLPLYVGNEAMKKHKLQPKITGYTQYDSRINFNIINSFAAGAFRVAHSGIQGFLRMFDYNYNLNNTVPISDWMNRPLIVEEGSNFDEFLLGLVTQPMAKFDRYFSNQMKNLLSRDFKPYGKDLISMDILRGRDHGLAPYVHYLEICTGFKASNFDSLILYMSREHVNLLKSNYKSVNDVDLLVGGTLENHASGSRLGTTFLCIFVEQFYRLKWGDRFWYEVKDQPHSFTKDQLTEIRRMTTSRLICDNSDRISKVPANSFLERPSKSNELKDCKDLPTIDWSKF